MGLTHLVSEVIGGTIPSANESLSSFKALLYASGIAFMTFRGTVSSVRTNLNFVLSYGFEFNEQGCLDKLI